MTSISNQNEKEEHLSVLLGNNDDVKLFRVPSYKLGTEEKSGDIISDLVVNMLKSWNCVDCIVNMVFDTTAANSGHLFGACVAILQSIQKRLLWSGCRYHIGEVILNQAFNDLQIKSYLDKSPMASVHCSSISYKSAFCLLVKHFQLLCL